MALSCPSRLRVSSATALRSPSVPERTAESQKHKEQGAAPDGFSQGHGMGKPSTARRPSNRWSLVGMTGLRGTHKPSNSLARNAQYNTIQKMLLLNAYPLAYIILWIPGIVNRLIEATGRENGAAEIIQASWQLVGLANAVTYGWNEGVASQVRRKFSERRGTC